MIPVIIISLERSVKRRERIGSALSTLAIDFQFLDAVDGQLLDFDQINSLAPPHLLAFDRPLTPGEVGCAASHLRAIQLSLARDDEFVCVLEDDAEISPDIPAFLAADALRALPRFDVLRLFSDPARWQRKGWKVTRLGERDIWAMARPGLAAVGQIYSLGGLRKVAEQVIFIGAPIDNVLYHDSDVSDLRILEVRPGLVSHNERFAEVLPSDVGYRTEPDRTFKRSVRRLHRKGRAALRFGRVWGLSGYIRLLRQWPPYGNFR